MFALCIALLALTNLLGSDATTVDIALQCDDRATIYRSDNGGASWTHEASTGGWTQAYCAEWKDVGPSTMMRVKCVNGGGPGGLIADVKVRGREYLTTNPLSSGAWKATESSNNNYNMQYFLKGTGAWGNRVDGRISSKANWVWNGCSTANSYVTFELAFSECGVEEEECVIAFETEQFAYLSGDPHFRCFNGQTHHFQGVGGGAYYLMKNCDVNDRKSQPYALAMNVVPYGNNGPTTARYLVLEVYDGPRVFYVFISSDTTLQKYGQVKWGASHAIDECGANLKSYSDGTLEFGDVSVTITGCASGTVYVTLDIDQDGEDCQVTFHMRREGYWGGYPYHYVRADVPQCYKCTQCGLFGDFQSPWGQPKMLACDGTELSYDCRWAPGEGGYDETGWTWEVEHVNSGTCSSDDAHPNGPPRDELCSADIKREAEAKCKAARDAKGACCEAIGGGFCQELEEDCIGDTCALAVTAAEIPKIVESTFTTVVKDECGECDLGFETEQFAYFSGDPHFRAFNGMTHHFQGVAGGMYYLMKNCDVTDRERMPFALAVRVAKWGNSRITIGKYLLLEVYDGPKTYYMWISSDTSKQRYAELTTGVTRDIDQCGGRLTAYSDGTLTFGKVSVTTRGCNSGTVYVTLNINQNGKACKVEFHIRREGYSNGVPYHYVRAEVPQCYKCAQCGLFGDFQSRWGVAEMLACDGSTIAYDNRWQPGEGGFDATGWSWEVENVNSGDCSSSDALPDDIRDENPGCSDAILEEAHVCCQRLLSTKKDCCDAIGGTFCEELEEDCYADACVMAETTDQVEGFARATFADVVQDECPATAADAVPLDAVDGVDNLGWEEPDGFAWNYPDHPNYPDYPDYKPLSTLDDYSQQWPYAMHVVAFLLGANLVCLAFNCLSKRRPKSSQYKVVSMDSAIETDTEVEPLA